MSLFPGNALFMAPMVDLSHVAYQELVRSFTGCDLFYSEMLNSRMVPMERPQTSVYLRWTRTDDLIFQILGNDPAKMAESAAKLKGYGSFGIDINMGCWMKKVTCHGWGVALMKDPGRASDVITAVRKVVKGPLSVKFRIGYRPDLSAMLDFASMLESSGIDFIVLHARTAEDGMSRRARWEYIGALKDRMKIPVVGNGDIRSARDACEMFRATACDGVMIGRQALIQPWIFRDIKAMLAGSDIPEPPELKEVFLDLLRLLTLYFPQDVALKRFKTALPWLCENLTFGHHLAKDVSREKTLDAAGNCLREWFQRGIS